MAYSVDRPNIQLDAQDCTSIKAHISDVNDSTHFRFLQSSANIMLDQTDLAALKASRDGANGAVVTANLNLTAADMAVIAPLIT